MTDDSKFNQLLSAMVSKPPLAVEKPLKEAPALSEVSSDSYGGTRTPKGKSEATS